MTVHKPVVSNGTQRPMFAAITMLRELVMGILIVNGTKRIPVALATRHAASLGKHCNVRWMMKRVFRLSTVHQLVCVTLRAELDNTVM